MHCCYELYGGRVLCAMLSAIGRLACAFFQVVGFTLGIEDILLTEQVSFFSRILQIFHNFYCICIVLLLIRV